MEKNLRNSRVSPLLAEREQLAASTNKRLHEALDRFEQNCLKVIPLGTKLSLRNLALEAGVNKDTPFSRYKNISVLAGNYRFPEIVARFKKLKSQVEISANKNNLKNQLTELRETIREYEKKFIKQCRVINEQDYRIVELETYCRELELQNSDLRKQKLNIIKFSNSNKE